MKMVSLFATAAAVALIAGSASAQAVTETNYVNPANAGNSGVIADELTATFSISGSVSPSCVLGNGDGDHRMETYHGMGPCQLHNPNYDFNDALLPVGATYWVKLVEAYLPKQK